MWRTSQVFLFFRDSANLTDEGFCSVLHQTGQVKCGESFVEQPQLE